MKTTKIEARVLSAVNLHANSLHIHNADLRERIGSLYEHLAGWLEEELEDVAMGAEMERMDNRDDEEANADFQQIDAVYELVSCAVKALKALGDVDDSGPR